MNTHFHRKILVPDDVSIATSTSAHTDQPQMLFFPCILSVDFLNLSLIFLRWLILKLSGRSVATCFVCTFKLGAEIKEETGKRCCACIYAWVSIDSIHIFYRCKTNIFFFSYRFLPKLATDTCNSGVVALFFVAEERKLFCGFPYTMTSRNEGRIYHDYPFAYHTHSPPAFAQTTLWPLITTSTVIVIDKHVTS